MKKEIDKILILQAEIDTLKKIVLKKLQTTQKSNLELVSEMDFSAQYICDVKKERRPINKEFLLRLSRIIY